jgi:hypothetical protein
MKTEIKTSIDPNPITGLNQEVVIAQIAYMDFDIAETKVKFRIYQLDKEGKRIKAPMTTYEVWETLTNANILTPQGITINEKNFPKGEEESDEDYQKRIDTLRENGIGEFDFWVSPLVPILNGALDQGKHLLDLSGGVVL